MQIYEVEGTYIVNQSDNENGNHSSVQHYTLRINSDDLYRITIEAIGYALHLDSNTTNSIHITKIRKLSEEEAYVLELNHISTMEIK